MATKSLNFEYGSVDPDLGVQTGSGYFYRTRIRNSKKKTCATIFPISSWLRIQGVRVQSAPCTPFASYKNINVHR